MTICLLLFLLQTGDWEYQPGMGFIDRKTMTQKSPGEFYEHGLQLAQARQTSEALAVFDLILNHVTEKELVERVRFRRGETLWSGSRFAEAYRALDDFLRLYPESEHAPRAKQIAMESAYLLVRDGTTENLLGLFPIIRTSKPGIALLRSILQRYPREPFTSHYYYLLAKFFVDDDELGAAETEVKFILSEYKDTVEAPKAILLQGEIGLRRYDAIDYDVKGLEDARRSFARFIDEAPFLSRISEEAAAFVRESLPYAQEKIAFINEEMAEKEFETAEYYRSKDRSRAARLYYQSIVRLYPQTSWAAKAKDRLKELEP